jgi:hypothetical protein
VRADATPQAGGVALWLESIAVKGASGERVDRSPAILPARNRNEIVMTNSNDLQLDRVHTAAIRREIGDRLRISLDAGRLPLTPGLFSLLERLAAQDRNDARLQLQRG